MLLAGNIEYARNAVCTEELAYVKVEKSVDNVFSENSLKEGLTVSSGFVDYLLNRKNVADNLVELNPRILCGSKVEVKTVGVDELLYLPAPLVVRGESPVDYPVNGAFPSACVLFEVCKLISLGALNW